MNHAVQAALNLQRVTGCSLVQAENIINEIIRAVRDSNTPRCKWCNGAFFDSHIGRTSLCAYCQQPMERK